MKMVKSLLLGSAAGVVAVTGAQAADLPVKAVAVQYVKICTLYGDGFYYIPGSDTCIKFSGYIRAQYGWNNTSAGAPHYNGAAGAQDRSVARYSTRHRATLAIDTRTSTPYGTLRTFSNIQLQNENTTESTNVTRAFIQWAGFTFGRTVSFTDHEGSIGDAGLRSLQTTQNDSTTGANGTNQIAYTWNLGNGITLNVGADEARNKSIANLSVNTVTVGADPTSFRHGASHPDPWVSLRVAQDWGRASVAVVGHKNAATYYNQGNAGVPVTCSQTGTTLCGYPSDVWGWAVIAGAEIKLDFLSPGSRVSVFGNVGQGANAYQAALLVSPGLFGSGNQVAYGVNTDSVYVNGSQQQLTSSWTVGGGFEYFWTRNFSTVAYAAYTEVNYNSTVVNNRWFCGANGAVAQNILLSGATACDPSFKFWQVGSVYNWFPLAGLRLAVDIQYVNIDTATNGAAITLSRSQGNRPTGVYTARNLGITSVMFRAQRDWGG